MAQKDNGNRVPFGLCKKFGIEISKDWTPRDAWEALKRGGYINSVSEAYEQYYREVNDKSTEQLAKEQRREIKGDRVTEINSATGKPKRPAPEKAYGFANKERQNTKNHVNHAKEMGYKNQRDYERAAVDFFNSSRGKLYYSELRERYYRYDEKTGEMAVSSNGIIHTYLKRTKKEFQRAVVQDKLDEN